MAKDKVRNFTIYLLKKDVEADQIFEDRVGDEPISVEHDGQSIGDLYVMKPFRRPPRWAQHFEGIVDTTVFGVGGYSSAVLLIRRKRTFAVTFGQGRHMLKNEAIEEHFGLRTAINLVGAEGIRSIDKRRLDVVALQSREQSSREVGTTEFGIDIEQDLLRAITGRPQDITLGEQVSGTDSIKVRVKTSLVELHEYLDKYLEKYESDDYKENFSWIDHLSEIRDKSKSEELNNELIKKVQAKDFSKTWLAAPDIIDWSTIAGFRYNAPKKGELHPDLNWPDCIATFPSDRAIDLQLLKDWSVISIDDFDNKCSKWSVYKCIYAELNIGNATYLLNNGRWYKIDADFVTDVDNACSKIPRWDVPLPEYNAKGEGAYNLFVVDNQPTEFDLMDQKLILHGGGSSKIEACDLYHKSKALVHVKRYGGSSTLSHLFAQGRVSGEIFKTDAAFRNKVSAELSDAFKIARPDNPPAENEYAIVFAVISDSDSDELVLPFFSRLNLRHTYRNLTGYGYLVYLVKVRVADAVE